MTPTLKPPLRLNVTLVLLVALVLIALSMWMEANKR